MDNQKSAKELFRNANTKEEYAYAEEIRRKEQKESPIWFHRDNFEKRHHLSGEISRYCNIVAWLITLNCTAIMTTFKFGDVIDVTIDKVAIILTISAALVIIFVAICAYYGGVHKTAKETLKFMDYVDQLPELRKAKTTNNE